MHCPSCSVLLGTRQDRGRGHNHGAVNPQFAPTGDLEGACQVNDMVEQVMQRVGLDEVGLADEGGVIGHRLEVELKKGIIVEQPVQLS